MDSGRSSQGVWARALELADRTPDSRNRYVDFLRAASICVVVLGHWLMAAPSIDRGDLTLSDMLQMAPWTQWLTWAFQVMPLFFIVGGYANAVSWESALRAERGYGEWLAARLRRLVRPIVPLVLLWVGIAFAARAIGTDPGLVRVGSQVALIPTWFLSVYVMVVVAAPAMHTLWSRFGVASFWALALGAVGIDALAFSFDLPLLRWANYAFVWLGVHHLGYAWRAGVLSGPARALGCAACGLAVLVFLVVAAGYPISMITVPGEALSNSRPPTLALLALGMLHGGLALSVEAPARRWLRRARPWAAAVLVNGTIMTVYLWHVTALVGIVALAVVSGGIGLGVAPGSQAWWLSRPIWILASAVVLWGFVAGFGRFEQAARSGRTTRPPAWQCLAGAAGVCAGLATLALGGVAAPGALLTLAGAFLATRSLSRRTAPT